MRRNFLWILAVVAMVPQAKAQNYFWNNPGGSWDLTTPVWGTSPGGPYNTTWANGFGNTATFLEDTFAPVTPITLGANIDLGGFTSQVTSSPLVFNAGTGTHIALGGSSAIFDIVGQSIFNVPVLGPSTALVKNGAGEIRFNTSSSTFNGFTLNQGTVSVNAKDALGTGTLTLNGGTMKTATSSGRSLNNAVSINGNVNFAAGGTLSFVGAATLTGDRTLTVDNTTAFLGAVGQTGGSPKIIKEGSGTLVFDAASTRTGGTDINAGAVHIGHNNALGSGAVRMADGTTLSSVNAGARTIPNFINVHGNITLGQDTGGTGVLTASGINLQGGTRTITTRGTSHSLSSVSNGSLRKAGSATLRLTGANSLTSLHVDEGRVIAVGRNSVGAGPVVVGNGARFDGTKVNAHITLESNSTLSSGDGVGTLTAGDINLNGQATYAVDINSAGGIPGLNLDTIVSTNGTMDLNGNTLVIQLVGNPGDFNNALNYNWTIAQFSNIADAGLFQVDTTQFGPNLGGGTFAVNLIGNQYLNLTFTAVPEPSTIALGALGAAAFFARAIRKRK